MFKADSPLAAAPLPIKGLSEIAGRYDVILSDVWGVVHNGVTQFASAVEALRRFRAQGGKVALITNAPRPNHVVQQTLDRLFVARNAYDAIISSGDVTLAMMASRNGAAFFFIGPVDEAEALCDAVAAQNGQRPRLGSVEEADYVVCTGLYTDKMPRPEDYDALLKTIRKRNLRFVCGNPDLVVNIGHDLVYCAGELARRYEKLGGEVIQAGKPFSEIYQRAFAALGGVADKAKVLVIGDAMRTDIAGAHAQALPSLFVTSGIHAGELHSEVDGQLNEAAFAQFIEASGFAPTAVIRDLAW
jgi:HAD superfamily hydrolase (TIGR01459 family)